MFFGKAREQLELTGLVELNHARAALHQQRPSNNLSLK